MEAKTARYENYRGKKKWLVEHPDHGKAIVLSPDAETAIVAAAHSFGIPWTKLEFYSGCKVSKV